MALHLARLTHLPPHLQCLVHARLSYSTASKNIQYPFPAQPKPTPHEIFHLNRGASQPDIKTRYIELVKLHHPDSHFCRDLTPAERHRRFQMISSAYDVLRLKRDIPERDRPAWEEIDRRKRAYHRHYRRAEYERAEWNHPKMDERWTDRVILAFGFVALAAGLVPVYLYPRQPIDKLPPSAYYLFEARRDARLLHEARIRELEAQADTGFGPGSRTK
ncbi:hypothetical protein B0H17DRAFT_1062264 [Mycena rosella]|uniref:J domain-containing protein n=1 Tax=Mycena rosella TaxID=1033263 RepID=A0AAD7GI47_MYCRO|nr:hypothetical protein B0H17DRAFT_1062264 [Mycena rosella]